MPQLISSTFPSQIFWALLGFCLVYLFVARIFAPRMNGIVEKRKFYINKLLNKAEKFKKEADKIKGKADAALENVQLDFCAAESKLTADFREKNLKEKASLYDLFSRKSKEESKKLEKSSTNTLLTISQDMDELIDLALQATVRRKTS